VGSDPSHAPLVSFHVLGPLEVRRGGEPLPLNAPKQRALLLRLLADVNRAVATDRLIDDLWDGAPPPGALSSLRAYVSNLRRLLHAEDDGARLATHPTGYVLELDTVAIDSHRFEAELDEARDAIGDGLPGQALELLDRGLGRWRGPAFVDVADLTFASPTITRLDELHRVAQEERFDALLALGRHDHAIADLERFVPTDPLRERPRRQLVLALHRAGRTPDALRVHRDFRELLADELGLDPSDLFEELVARILRRDPTLDAPAGRRSAPLPTAAPDRAAAAATPDASAASAPTALAAAPMASRLVGRARERELIGDVLALLHDGRPGVLLLGGEPGIGKTTLLDEVARLAAGRAAVHWGRCPETEGAPAFWPWSRVLRSIAASATDEELAAVAADAAAMAHLVPDLARRTGVAPPLVGDDLTAARFELFDAVTTFLHHRAGDGLILLLDDLHWADPPSLELLGYVVANLGDVPVLLAGTYRDAPADRSTALDATLASVVRRPGALDLHLHGLEADEVAEVVTATLGRAPTAGLVEMVHTRTDGNPFFVTQLARFLDEASANGRSVPSGVRHVLARRVQLLPPDAQRVLELAAVVGRRFDAAVVAEAADVDLPTVLEHADAAFTHGLLEPDGGSTRRFRFIHALVRETLYDGLSPATTLRSHAAVAQALLAQGAASAQELAEHLWSAGGLVPATDTIRWAVAAADESLAALAYEQAEAHLRRALQLLDGGTEADLATELAVRVRLVSLLTSAVGWSAPDIADVAGAVVELTERHGLRPELLPLWHLAWTCRTTRGDIPGGLAMADELAALAARHDDELHAAMARSMRGYCLLHAGADGEEALALITSAKEALDRQPDEHLAATPEHLGVTVRLAWISALSLTQGRDEVIAATEEVVAYATRVGRPFPRVAAHLFAAWAAAIVDEPEVTGSHARAGLALCTEFGFRQATLLLTPLDGWATARLGGEPAVEAARIAAATEALDAAGHLHARPSWAVLLAEVRLLAGDVAGAEAAVADARAIVEHTGEHVQDRFLDGAAAATAAAAAAGAVRGDPAVDQTGSGWLETNRPAGS
jgi:DNA-binding SARP family transcriptional activator